MSDRPTIWIGIPLTDPQRQQILRVEPVPPDSPLGALPNVLITPHTAGSSPHEFQRIVDLFCDNLRRYLAGEPLRNRFDFDLGY